MMLMKKRTSVFLSLILVLSIASGCVMIDGDGSKGEEVGTGVTSKEPAEEQKPLEISMTLSHGNNAYLTGVRDINSDEHIKNINEIANVKLDIQFVDHSKHQELFNLMYSSGDIPDVVVHFGIGTTVSLNAVKEGIFLNMKPYINEENTPNLIDKVSSAQWNLADVLRDGGIYFIPKISLLKVTDTTFIRLDLLEKYNLDAPDTLDDYLNVMRVFKQNGVKYPTSGREGFVFTNSFFGAFGVIPGTYILDDEGKIVPSGITSQMKEALRFHRQIYEEELLDPEFLSNTGVVWATEKVHAGDVGIFNHIVRNYPNQLTNIRKSVPDAELIMLPGPKGPDGKRSSMTEEATVSQSVYVNKKVKEPARLMRFFDWMVSDKGQEFFNIGIETDGELDEKGLTHKKVDGKIEFNYPTDPDDVLRMSAKGVVLNILGDTFVRKDLCPFMPGGDKILEYSEKYGSVVSAPYVLLLGEDLEIHNTSPELKTDGSKTSLWLEMASKVIYGKEPLEYFDTWVEYWKSRGGDKVLEELEGKRKANLFVEVK